jgi:hypothetical protein
LISGIQKAAEFAAAKIKGMTSNNAQT